MLAVEHNDLIVFEKVDIKTFKLKYIKGHHRTYVNPMFYCVMTDTESKDLLLHSAFMENYFKNDPLDCRFTILYPKTSLMMFYFLSIKI
ncbi:hypothetical protein Hanom_Chr12g01086271 [Helianthus anomalus]